MLNYETLLIFVYFLILCGGQSTLNICIRTLQKNMVLSRVYKNAATDRLRATFSDVSASFM